MKRKRKQQRPATPPPVAALPIAFVERAPAPPLRECGEIVGSAAIADALVLERTAYITGSVVL